MTESDDYQNELVTRCAPRWAWGMIDETLALDIQSRAFDFTLRSLIENAYHAMIKASEDPEPKPEHETDYPRCMCDACFEGRDQTLYP